MTARLRKLLSDMSEMFWLLPAAMVFAGIVLAEGLVQPRAKRRRFPIG